MYEDPHQSPGQGPQPDNPFEASYVPPGSPYPEDYSQGELTYEDQQTRQWALILHISQFAGWIIPFGGFLVPFIIWQIKKDTLPGIDEHGREVMNWVITEVIYFVGSILLCLVVIGVPFLIATIIAGVIFPIIGAVKASDGVCWRYPLNLRFF